MYCRFRRPDRSEPFRNSAHQADAAGGPDRWTFVYENLNEVDHVDVIVDGATKYLATEDGLVKWRERPEHFRKNCAARIPPIGALK